MKIQRAKKEDHSILSEITYLGKSYWGYEKEQLEKWKDDLTITTDYIKNNETYKLIIENKIIGYYSILKTSKDEIKLDNIFILPEYIGKGYGKVLMIDCINKVRKLSVKTIVLDSEPNAEKFYTKLGFEVCGQLKSSIKNRYLPKMKFNL